MKKRKGKRKYGKYTVEFKVTAVERMLAGENVKALARVLNVSRTQLYCWLERYREQGTARLQGPGRPSFEEAVERMATPAERSARRIAELERKVGQQSLEVDFLKKAFKRVKESRQPNTAPGATASMEKSEQ